MIVNEGAAQIELPSEPVKKGPGTRTVGFYNPSQRLNRDLTLSFLAAKRPEKFLDAFGASGIRGIRVDREAGISTVMSEINPASYRIALNNIERNSARVEIFNESFEKTIERHLFDFIDIDPYGSIIPYIDKAITGVRNRGFVGATATDLSSLTGSVRAKTKRRYDAYIKTDMFKHEMGIRLLISYIAKRAAVLDMAATPEISFWHSHFYRVIFRVEHGAAKADNTLEQIGTLNKHKLLSNTYEDADEGPVWKGKLSNPDTVKSMADEKLVHSSPKSESYLNYLENEDTSVLFLELSDIARNVRSNMPPMEAVAQHLADMGVKSHRTHYSFSGLKVEDSLMTAYDNISKLMTEKYR